MEMFVLKAFYDHEKETLESCEDSVFCFSGELRELIVTRVLAEVL